MYLLYTIFLVLAVISSRFSAVKPQVVNGGWSSWAYEEGIRCSVTCGVGVSLSSRRCNNPYPAYGGDQCSGAETKYKYCHATKSCRKIQLNVTKKVDTIDALDTEPAAIGGGWSEWQAVDGIACSTTCGMGVKLLKRTCNNPYPSYGGAMCIGNDINNEYCNLKPCAIHGGWTEWSAASCSVTCGTGTKHYTRTCSAPAPEHEGRTCPGPAEKTDNENCNEKPCQMCPAGFGHELKGTKYMVVTESKYQADAIAHCKSLGVNSRLADALDLEELHHLVNITTGTVTYTWLDAAQVPGATEPAGGWKWTAAGVDIDPSMWISGEPNNHSGNEHLANLNVAAKKLNDVPASNTHSSICEC